MAQCLLFVCQYRLAWLRELNRGRNLIQVCAHNIQLLRRHCTTLRPRINQRLRMLRLRKRTLVVQRVFEWIFLHEFAFGLSIRATVLNARQHLLEARHRHVLRGHMRPGFLSLHLRKLVLMCLSRVHQRRQAHASNLRRAPHFVEIHLVLAEQCWRNADSLRNLGERKRVRHGYAIISTG